MTHFPPAYPLMLAAVSLLTGNLVQTARILNSLLFGANAVLIAWAVHSATGRRVLPAFCAALFFITSQPLLELHAWAWSEPLFISLCLISVQSLAAYAKWPGLRWHIGSALAVGAATLTRYAGLALIPPGLLVILLATRQRRATRTVGKALAWGALALAPIALFSLRNWLWARSAVDRLYAFHPMPLSEFGLRVLAAAFQLIAPDGLPPSGRWAVFGLIATLCLGCLFFLKRLRRPILRDWHTLASPAVCVSFCVCYLLLLLASITYWDASISILDMRLLLPCLVVLLVGVSALAWRIRRPLWWSLGVCLFLLAAIRIPTTFRFAVTSRAEGLGYLSLRWSDLRP